MPLIDSLDSTKLKSLRYSGPGPAVQVDINNPPVYNSLSHEAQARTNDIQRIGYAMALSGGQFIPNTAALNAIAPRTESQKPIQRDAADRPPSSKSVLGQVADFFGAAFGAVIQQAGGAAVSTAAVTGETLAQVGASGTGTHFVLGFGAGQKYLKRTNGHILSEQGVTIPIPSGFSSELKNAFSALTPKPGFNDTRPEAGQLFKGVELPKVSAFEYIKTGFNTSRKLYDFTKPDFLKQPEEISSTVNKERRLGLSKNRKLARYTDKYTGGRKADADQVNISGVKTGPQDDLLRQQMIKFFFEVINPNGAGTGSEIENKYLYFRAYLDSLTDSYTGNWNSIRYLGRAEDFWVYDGFARTFNFSFKAAADSRHELKPMYDKLKYLASTTAPTYADSSGFMRGTLVNITIGDYLVSQPGYISQLDYSWQTNYPWEINLEGSPSMLQVPHVLDCNVAFTPIHRFAPQTGKSNFFGLSDQNILDNITADTDLVMEDLDLEETEADIAAFDFDND